MNTYSETLIDDCKDLLKKMLKVLSDHYLGHKRLTNIDNIEKEYETLEKVIEQNDKFGMSFLLNKHIAIFNS